MGLISPRTRDMFSGTRLPFNDYLMGGDIDLLVETSQVLSNRTEATGKIYAKIIPALGDRKIDMILKDGQTPEAPIDRIAHHTGVPL